MKCRMNRTIDVVSLLVCISAFSGPTRGDEIIDAVTRFADTVVEHGRDRYGEKHTPLFVDVLNVDTLKSPELPQGLAGVDGSGVVMSNFAYQQNLLRTLVALSNLTGETKYRREAERATRHVFQHQMHEESGLFYWGIHTFLDLEADSLRHYGTDQHEVKSVYPFYEFLHEVDPEKTERFIKNMWLAHIENWSLLTFNRHGAYRACDQSRVWDHEWDDPGPDARANGLTFFNAGSDFVYAGFYLGMNADDEKASLWAGRLFERFVVGRDHTTRIMPSSSVRQSHRERGTAQFKFPNAFEPNLYVQYLPESVMARSDFAMLRTAERLSQAGFKEASRKMLEPLCEHLIGYAKHAYEPRRNVFRPIITDGTDLTGYRLPNDGYYGPQGTVMEVIPAGVEFLPSYALAFRLQKAPALWETLRHLCKGNGLGEIGEEPGLQPKLDHSYTGAFPLVVFTMVEVYNATQEHAYLRFAEHVCKNILRQRYHPDNGLFTLDDDHLGCHLDCYEPLALLTVVAAKQNKLDRIPTWDAGGRYPWNHNTILSGYSTFANRPSMQAFVLRRTVAKQ
jgi:pectate lyase